MTNAKTYYDITTPPEGWEFCGMMQATHTVDIDGNIETFNAQHSCRRVAQMYPHEKSPLSVVASANIQLGCKSIRKVDPK